MHLSSAVLTSIQNITKKIKSNQINKSPRPPCRQSPRAAELCYILRSLSCPFTGRTGSRCSEEARLVGSPGCGEAECQRRQPSGSSAAARPRGWTHSLRLEGGLKLFFLIKDRPLCHGLSWRASARWRPNVLRPNLIWGVFSITWLIAVLLSQSAGSHLSSIPSPELQVTQQHRDMTHCNG